MPCPEKFRESLEKFNVDSDTVAKIQKLQDILTWDVPLKAYPKIIASAAQDILSIIMKSCSA